MDPYILPQSRLIYIHFGSMLHLSIIGTYFTHTHDLLCEYIYLCKSTTSTTQQNTQSCVNPPKAKGQTQHNKILYLVSMHIKKWRQSLWLYVTCRQIYNQNATTSPPHIRHTHLPTKIAQYCFWHLTNLNTSYIKCGNYNKKKWLKL